MMLSKPKKILIGMLTAWVILYLFLFSAMIITLFMRGGVLPIGLSVDSFFNNLFVIHCITTLISWGLLGFYLIHLIKNNTASQMVRAVLGLGIFFLPFIGMPVYFYLFIWRDQPPEWTKSETYSRTA